MLRVDLGCTVTTVFHNEIVESADLMLCKMVMVDIFQLLVNTTQGHKHGNRRLCTHMATPHSHVFPIDSHSHSVPINGPPLQLHDNVVLGTNETSPKMTF